MKKTLKIIVKGRVQGVGYRWFARQAAHELGLTGYVRNLPDGNVEVVAQGEEAVLNQFIQELNRGPGFAYVVDMDIEELDIPSDKYRSFEIAF
ncbi:acylphosphatase [Calditrichota bacterium GD2]